MMWLKLFKQEGGSAAGAGYNLSLKLQLLVLVVSVLLLLLLVPLNSTLYLPNWGALIYCSNDAFISAP
jgi:hypothetical protein